MGNEGSRVLDRVTNIPGPVTYFSITLKDPDKIHLVPYDSQISELVVYALDSHHKVLEHRPLDSHVYMIKVSGSPFSTANMGDSEGSLIEMKLSWCVLFSKLGLNGWSPVMTSNLAQRRSGSTIFFRKMVGEFAADTSMRPTMCVTTSGWDKLILINLPGTLEARLTHLIDQKWGTSSARIIEKGKDGIVLQLKLSGSPWTGTSGETCIQIRKMFLDTVKTLQSSMLPLIGHENVYNYLREVYTTLPREITLKNAYEHQKSGKVNFNSTTDSLFFQNNCDSFGLSSAEEMFCISLNKADRLRVIDANPDVLHLIPNLIQQSWPNGLQQAREYHSSQEFKLSGSPWWPSGDEDFFAKRLVATLIGGLKLAGWEVYFAAKISNQLDDKSIIIFHQKLEFPVINKISTTSMQVKPINEWMALGFHSIDKIRFCSGPGAKSGSHENIVKLIRDQLEGAKFLDKEVEHKNDVEWRLTGSPFSGSFGTGDEQRIVLLYLSRLLREFNFNGWKLTASLDMSSRYHSTKREKYKENCDCWVLVQEPRDRLHLAALNPPSIIRYLGSSREELNAMSGQFDSVQY